MTRNTDNPEIGSQSWDGELLTSKNGFGYHCDWEYSTEAEYVASLPLWRRILRWIRIRIPSRHWKRLKRGGGEVYKNAEYWSPSVTVQSDKPHSGTPRNLPDLS